MLQRHTSQQQPPADLKARYASINVPLSCLLIILSMYDSRPHICVVRKAALGQYFAASQVLYFPHPVQPQHWFACLVLHSQLHKSAFYFLSKLFSYLFQAQKACETGKPHLTARKTAMAYVLPGDLSVLSAKLQGHPRFVML